MKSTIAFIGSGNLGTELATRLVNSAYRLLIFDQHLAKSQLLVNQLLTVTPTAEVEAIDCPTNASWEADIIVLAVPELSKKEVADRIRDVAVCKIVISLYTPLHDEESRHFESTAIYVGEELQQRLPNSKVVNVIIMGEERTDAFLISTHPEALITVSTLIQNAGLNPIVAEDWSVDSTKIL
ncbi:NAD(P)-binding domain-containing protein [Spirosoma foliorum]|uniref:NAD(P)-binding domain-containing protein n=1 Tax=Spirosoma foliorum TaxID=2710596 RepID=A0A7G5GPU5_9BACT|nr:NAD(P)-binding domain-containing protein [Spirosoma foliorum]QMW00887.1 NAD(P)-binding domain-containing protein [Spirosoma foliorum]